MRPRRGAAARGSVWRRWASPAAAAVVAALAAGSVAPSSAWAQEVSPPAVPAAAPPRRSVPPSPEPAAPERLTAVGWTAVGMAIAGQLALTGGIASGIFAWVKRDASEDVDADCTDDCPQRAVDLNDQAETGADVATGLFVAAGVLDLAALTIYFTSGPAFTEPVPGAQGVRLEARGASARVVVDF